MRDKLFTVAILAYLALRFGAECTVALYKYATTKDE